MSAGKFALAAVQQAVYGVLHGDATLATLAPGGVWDHVPEDPTWPYVRIGELAETTEDDTGGLQLRRVALTVHVWSQYRGRSEAYAIAERLVALLRRVPLTVTGWIWADTSYDGGQADEPMFDTDDESLVQHVSVDFTVRVEEA